MEGIGEVAGEKPRILRIYDPMSDPTDRQKRIKGWNQERIEKARVLVVGAGGLGNEIVKHLVMLGFKKIYIADYDQVVEANLNRCIFFRMEDAKKRKNKALTLAERAKEMSPYPDTEIIPLSTKIGDEGITYDDKLWKDIDLVFGAVDNVMARVYLSISALYNSRELKRSIPVVDGGVRAFNGNIFVMVPFKTACLACELPESVWTDPWKRASCSGSSLPNVTISPSLPTTFSIIAALQVNEAIKILHDGALGKPLIGKRLCIDLSRGDWYVYEVPKNKSCKVCSMVPEG